MYINHWMQDFDRDSDRLDLQFVIIFCFGKSGQQNVLNPGPARSIQQIFLLGYQQLSLAARALMNQT